MKCPHCEQEIAGSQCLGCGKTNPEEAHYCMHCGEHLGHAQDTVGEGDDPLDLASRVLCPDELCTGIIEDGKCTECGKRVPEDGEQGGEKGPKE